LKCPKCGREFDVEVEGNPLVSRAGTRTMNVSGVFVVYDEHRLAIHPIGFLDIEYIVLIVERLPSMISAYNNKSA